MRRIDQSPFPVIAKTHAGMRGKNNEDRFGVSAFQLSGEAVLLAVLSDGIGGHRAGEVASEMVVNFISRMVAKSDGFDPRQIINEAIQQASDAIHQQAQQHPDQQGMGATCAVVWIARDHLYTATVGDSRIYLMRAGEIYQLSTDHTWIQEALDRGILQPEQISGHPNAHVIRRYLGSPQPPEVDFRMKLPPELAQDAEAGNSFVLLPGDRVLLCSDGLSDLVRAEEINVAFSSMPLQEVGDSLIDLANERGGHDNITLVAIEIPQDVSMVSAPATQKKKGSPLGALALGCLGVILIGVLVGVLWGGSLLGGIGGERTPTVQVSPSATAPLLETTVFPRITHTATSVATQPLPITTLVVTATLAETTSVSPTLTP